MSKLSTSERNALPTSDFALGPDRYPIENESHARAALQRVSQFGSEAEKVIVRARVKSKFPNIHISKV